MGPNLEAQPATTKPEIAYCERFDRLYGSLGLNQAFTLVPTTLIMHAAEMGISSVEFWVLTILLHHMQAEPGGKLAIVSVATIAKAIGFKPYAGKDGNRKVSYPGCRKALRKMKDPDRPGGPLIEVTTGAVEDDHRADLFDPSPALKKIEAFELSHPPDGAA